MPQAGTREHGQVDVWFSQFFFIHPNCTLVTLSQGTRFALESMALMILLLQWQKHGQDRPRQAKWGSSHLCKMLKEDRRR